MADTSRNHQPTLVAISGLPGVGKSTLANSVARHFGFALLELDQLESQLFKHGIRGDDLGWGGYAALTAITAQNLQLGVGVVIDSVAWTNHIRNDWRELAATHQASFRPIEVVCSDGAIHGARIEAQPSKRDMRKRLTAGGTYEPWDTPRLVLDSSAGLDQVLSDAIAYIQEDDARPKP